MGYGSQTRVVPTVASEAAADLESERRGLPTKASCICRERGVG